MISEEEFRKEDYMRSAPLQQGRRGKGAKQRVPRTQYTPTDLRLYLVSRFEKDLYEKGNLMTSSDVEIAIIPRRPEKKKKEGSHFSLRIHWILEIL